ncbi:hypothetical protein HanIR_Chr16g0824901 [Helianthus annuus]|nr:hypothetical protein HanIR_Chr16g0824901 [Helianthus annuus]
MINLLDGGPSVEDQAMAFLEALDRATKSDYENDHNFCYGSPFQAFNQSD